MPGTSEIIVSPASAPLNLPSEIWRQVFDEFRDDNYTWSGRINWRAYTYRYRDHIPEELYALQSLRLVCRFFNHIASPLLCTFIRLEISQSSMDRLLGLAKNELIIGGLRGIQLSLAYRPSELAHDLGRYMRYKKEMIHFKVIPHCEIETESLSRDSATEANDPRGHRLFKCLDEYEALSSAWEEYVSSTQTHSEDLNPHQQILRKSFESYKNLHEEQYKLLIDGSLVHTIANVVARARYPIALNLNDHIFWYEDDHDFDDEDYSTGIVLDRWKLDRLLIESHSWEDLEVMPEAPMVLPIRVLTELPISIHQAGGNLTSLSIDCFSPKWTGVPMMYSCDSSSKDLWHQLRTACQQLKTFEFGAWIMNEAASTRHEVKDEERVYVDSYISTMLASPRLEEATIDMASFHRHDDFYRLGTSLLQGVRPKLHKLSIDYVHLSQKDLEAICRLLGPNPNFINISVTKLTDGSWSDALQMLSSQVVSSPEGNGCEVSFFYLTGGEFGEEAVTMPDDDEDDKEQVKAYEEYERKIKEAEEYVLGSNDCVAWNGGYLPLLRTSRSVA